MMTLVYQRQEIIIKESSHILQPREQCHLPEKGMGVVRIEYDGSNDLHELKVHNEVHP